MITPTHAPTAPTAPTTAAADSAALIDNTLRGPDCPLFIATIIRGVRVGPSPAWLKDRLAAIGQRSINNIVDATNYVLAELGQPSHVFDLATLSRTPGKPLLTIRSAAKGESLALLDARTITLTGAEMVIADAAGTRPVSLAGVMGGALTGVTDGTTDVLLEVATWDPTRVRTAARRHSARTDSSHRYERVVDARTLEPARARLVELITQLGGGQVERAEADGIPPAPLTAITLRHARLQDVLGINVRPEQVARVLAAQGLIATPTTDASKSWLVRVPPHRHDVTIEIDLIEEVARTLGYGQLGVPEFLPVRVAGLQSSQRARAEMARVLTGLGFFEAVTFSFTSQKQAKLFLPEGRELVRVGDDRRGEENVCRPSALCGLLTCRRSNQDARVTSPGGVRLFELSATFSQLATPAAVAPVSRETRTLALLADAPETGTSFERRQAGVRLVRGVVEELARALVGFGARLEVVPLAGTDAGTDADASRDTSSELALRVAGFDQAASGLVVLNGRVIGRLGLISDAARAQYDLQAICAAAELDADALMEAYPPRAIVRELPSMPAVERDLSLVVSENVAWATLERTISQHRDQIQDLHPGRAALLEGWSFVGTYRGQPLAAGTKSVTLRLVFRDATRTLRDEEVSPQVEVLVTALKAATGATLRV